MGFRLVPKSVTLDDLERRNSHKSSVISPPPRFEIMADYFSIFLLARGDCLTIGPLTLSLGVIPCQYRHNLNDMSLKKL